jgi:hypothetical protein
MPEFFKNNGYFTSSAGSIASTSQNANKVKEKFITMVKMTPRWILFVKTLALTQLELVVPKQSNCLDTVPRW